MLPVSHVCGCQPRVASFVRGARPWRRYSVGVSGPSCQHRVFRVCTRVQAQSPTPPGVPPDMDPEKLKQLQEEAMKNPEVAQRLKSIEEAMKNPAVQQKMQETMAVMQSEEMQKRLKALQEDEELKPMFEEMRTGGMAAMMKYFNDPEMLMKVGKKLGPIPGVGAGPAAPPPQTAPAAADTAAAAPPPPPPPPPPAPEVNDLLDAARLGDLEAIEDFLAIGKDPNIRDKEQRTPLHFAVATQHMDIIDALCGAGADIDLRDAKDNTPLHYAAGYGRPIAAKRLLDNGANAGLKNQSGKTPFDLAKLNPENPILKDEQLLKRVEEGAASAPAFEDQ